MGNKKYIVAILLVTIFTTSFSGLSYGENMNFKDIDKSYAKEEIEALFKDGIMNGKDQGYFKPKDKMTRAELAAVIVRLLKLEEDKEAAKVFEDVPENAWYIGYIGALIKAGITDGTSPTTFSPNKNVTRQELAVFFIRALGLEQSAKEQKIKPNFTDNKEIEPWATHHVGLASKIGFINGISNSDGSYRYEPKKFAERQALAKLAYSFNYNKDSYINIIKEEEIPEEPKDTTSTEKKSEDPKPAEPKPIDPKPVEPQEPIDEDKNETIKVVNIEGKKSYFMGAFLLSVDFDIEGDIGEKKVEVIVNDGTDTALSLKRGHHDTKEYYFDGMSVSIDSFTLYIGENKYDLKAMLGW